MISEEAMNPPLTGQSPDQSSPPPKRPLGASLLWCFSREALQEAPLVFLGSIWAGVMLLAFSAVAVLVSPSVSNHSSLDSAETLPPPQATAEQPGVLQSPSPSPEASPEASPAITSPAEAPVPVPETPGATDRSEGTPWLLLAAALVCVGFSLTIAVHVSRIILGSPTPRGKSPRSPQGAKLKIQGKPKPKQKQRRSSPFSPPHLAQPHLRPKGQPHPIAPPVVMPFATPINTPPLAGTATVSQPVPFPVGRSPDSKGQRRAQKRKPNPSKQAKPPRSGQVIHHTPPNKPPRSGKVVQHQRKAHPPHPAARQGQHRPHSRSHPPQSQPRPDRLTHPDVTIVPPEQTHPLDWQEHALVEMADLRNRRSLSSLLYRRAR